MVLLVLALTPPKSKENLLEKRCTCSYRLPKTFLDKFPKNCTFSSWISIRPPDPPDVRSRSQPRTQTVKRDHSGDDIAEGENFPSCYIELTFELFFFFFFQSMAKRLILHLGTYENSFLILPIIISLF